MTTTDNKKFLADIFGTSFLDQITDWIRVHVDPSDLYTDDQLNEWAGNNGFVQER